jgi:hypothetical protein
MFPVTCKFEVGELVPIPITPLYTFRVSFILNFGPVRKIAAYPSFDDASCAPTIAVFPSDERVTEFPNCPAVPAVDVSGCADPHDPPVNLKTAAYPSADDAVGAPTIAVFPSDERVTEFPKNANVPAVDVSGCADPHDPPVNLKTAAYPLSDDAPGAPTIAVFPSDERATEFPKYALVPAVDVSGCADPHDPPVNLKTAAYPSPDDAVDAPTIAVFPSDERTTEYPKRALVPAVDVSGEAVTESLK